MNLRGKTYRVIAQIDDPDFIRGRIMPDIYPTVLAYFGRERMPMRVFESSKGCERGIATLYLSDSCFRRKNGCRRFLYDCAA